MSLEQADQTFRDVMTQDPPIGGDTAGGGQLATSSSVRCGRDQG